MDHSESLINLLREKCGKCLISNSGLSKWIELINSTEYFLNIKGTDSGQSSSQRKASHPNASPAIKWSQSLNIFPNISLYTLEGIIEALMDQTPTAGWIFDLSGIEVGDPVLDINGASESDNNCIFLFRISCEAIDI